MALLKQHSFICIDCEATGLDPKNDRVVEVAVVRFTLQEIQESFDSLINPECTIPEQSIAIHKISQDMVAGKPIIASLLPSIRNLIGNLPIVGHNVRFDIDILQEEAKRANIEFDLSKNFIIDTLRLARLYGESPSNSLETLRMHFQIEAEETHRALGDVLVNIQVFKRLSHTFKTLFELKEALSQPVLMKIMPLGKHKGRPIKELPLDYLSWAARQNFDVDLLFSLRSELNRRKKGSCFFQAVNPFQDL